LPLGTLSARAGRLKPPELVAAVYDGVRENPTTRDVDACVQAAREANVDLLVGLGGGSSMDTAKGRTFC
jgi:alcohol dehydrogenase